LRGEGFMVGFDPLPENPYHGEVWGAFSKAKQKRLPELCQWFFRSMMCQSADLGYTAVL
jgi:hypothetical protein